MKGKRAGLGILGTIVLGFMLFFSNLAGCIGGGGWLPGLGGGGTTPGTGNGKSSTPKTPATDAKDTAVSLENKAEKKDRLGLEVTKDEVVLNVYVVNDALEFAGEAVTPKELVARINALKILHPGKKVKVVAQTVESTRMKGLQDLREAIRGVAEYVGPNETGTP